MTMTIGEMIDELYEVREQQRALTKQLKEIDEDMDSREQAILEKLKELGLESTRAGKATATISSEVVPIPRDWDAIYTYIKDNDAMYLVQKRLTVTAWREMYNQGELLPGTEVFRKETLSLRKR